VICDVGDLVRIEPEVERVQDSTEARHGKVCLDVLLVVPHERRDPVAAADSDPAQGVS
jgi:hypothetical protein